MFHIARNKRAILWSDDLETLVQVWRDHRTGHESDSWTIRRKDGEVVIDLNFV